MAEKQEYSTKNDLETNIAAFRQNHQGDDVKGQEDVNEYVEHVIFSYDHAVKRVGVPSKKGPNSITPDIIVQAMLDRFDEGGVNMKYVREFNSRIRKNKSLGEFKLSFDLEEQTELPDTLKPVLKLQNKWL